MTFAFAHPRFDVSDALLRVANGPGIWHVLILILSPSISRKSRQKQLEQSGFKTWKVALSLPCLSPPFICISLLLFCANRILR